MVVWHVEPVDLPFPDALRNLRGGTPFGGSQTTAVVERLDSAARHGTVYPVAFRAALVEPYFVRLSRPVSVGG